MDNDHTLAQLQAHPVRPSAETRANVKDFNELMRLKPPAPVVMPPAEGGFTGTGHKAWMATVCPPPIDYRAHAASLEAERLRVAAAANEAKAIEVAADAERVRLATEAATRIALLEARIAELEAQPARAKR